MAGRSTPLTVYPLAILKSEFFQETRFQTRSTENPSAVQSLEGTLGGSQARPTRLHPPTQEAADTQQEQSCS